MTHAPRALLFDLGGVIVDIDFQRAIDVWQRSSKLAPEAVGRAFAFDGMYERHERGEIEAADYYAHLARTLQIDSGHESIAQGWNAIFLDEIAPTLAMVRAVRPLVPCHIFSNTNLAHAQTWRQRFPQALREFDRVFCSHEIGLRKPEREAFEHVARAIGVATPEVLFFDDRLDNVEGARAAGMKAVHVRGPQDVRDALLACGLVPRQPPA